MINGKMINLVVASSNLVGLYDWSQVDFMILLMIVCSVLMHLSETKHGLLGIYPFNLWSYQFLWLDRIMAYVLTIQTLFYLYYKWNHVSQSLLLLGLCGVSLMGISEIIVTNQQIVFMISHSLWLIMAYLFYFQIKSLI